MGGVCSLGGLVFGTQSYSDEEAFASHGEKQQRLPALQSVGKKRGRKTAPETVEENMEDGEVPMPAAWEMALPGKGKAKVSEVDTCFSKTCKAISGKPSKNSKATLARLPTSKGAMGSMMSCISVNKSRKIKILAFEVASTIAKGSNLMRLLSEQSVRRLKDVVIQTQGVQCLVSDDYNEVLALVGDEIREEFKEFSADVTRFGNLCRNPKWHNLDKHFSGLECGLKPEENSKEEAASKMENLMAPLQQTVKLYNGMLRLDMSEKMYKEAKLEKEKGKENQPGLPLRPLKKAVKIERKLVRHMKKNALWTKKMEKIVEELVYIVQFLSSEINSIFSKEHENGSVEATGSLQQTLGSANLELHYAKIFLMIRSLALLAPTTPKCGVDILYQALPSVTKSALETKLSPHNSEDKRTVEEIRDEMDRTFKWLIPMAEATPSLGRRNKIVGDWMLRGGPSGQDEGKVLKIQTLYYADKEKTEGLILDLVLDLHHLVCASRARLQQMMEDCSTSDISTEIQEAISLDITSITDDGEFIGMID